MSKTIEKDKLLGELNHMCDGLDGCCKLECKHALEKLKKRLNLEEEK